MPADLFGDAQLANTFAALGISDNPILGETEQQLLRQIAVVAANLTGGGGGGSGTVTDVSVVTANGVSGSVATSTTTPAITLTLGNITPSQVTISTAGAASTSEIAVTGSIFTGGSATTTKPKVLIEPTGATSNNWSTGGTLLGLNAPSGFAGYIMDLQVNADQKIAISAAGGFRELKGDSSDYFWRRVDINAIMFHGNSQSSIGILPAALNLAKNVVVGWTNDTPANGPDTTLFRAAAGVLSLGSGNALRLGVTAAAGVALTSTSTLTVQDATGATYRLLARND